MRWCWLIGHRFIDGWEGLAGRVFVCQRCLKVLMYRRGKWS